MKKAIDETQRHVIAIYGTEKIFMMHPRNFKKILEQLNEAQINTLADFCNPNPDSGQGQNPSRIKSALLKTAEGWNDEELEILSRLAAETVIMKIYRHSSPKERSRLLAMTWRLIGKLPAGPDEISMSDWEYLLHNLSADEQAELYEDVSQMIIRRIVKSKKN